MNDRQNVIKGLELLHDRLLDASKRDAIAMLDASMVADAIDLLKEQEDLGTELTNAVELIHKKNERIKELLKEQEPKAIEYHDNPFTGLPVAHCPNCMRYARQFHSSVEEETHFCPWCGQAVKWNDKTDL